MAKANRTNSSLLPNAPLLEFDRILNALIQEIEPRGSSSKCPSTTPPNSCERFAIKALQQDRHH
jgi:hypothetical protein